jgi:phosphatidylglycerophosphate synthase
MKQDIYIPERRPIRSRELGISHRMASYLVAWGVAPNAISVLGMCFGVAAGAVLPFTLLTGWTTAAFLAAAALMQLRLLANMLDGMVAVQTEKASPVGELFNEVPDRISDTAIFIGAGYAAGSLPELGYLAACAAMFTAYVRAEGKVAGAHQEFCGPMAKPQRMFLLTAICLVCATFPRHTTALFRTEALETGLMSAALLVVTVGGCLTALRRLVRVAKALTAKTV